MFKACVIILFDVKYIFVLSLILKNALFVVFKLANMKSTVQVCLNDYIFF
jgi:hypothetical protein